MDARYLLKQTKELASEYFFSKKSRDYFRKKQGFYREFYDEGNLIFLISKLEKAEKNDYLMCNIIPNTIDVLSLVFFQPGILIGEGIRIYSKLQSHGVKKEHEKLSRDSIDEVLKEEEKYPVYQSIQKELNKKSRFSDVLRKDKN
jgi:hypothetical protein